MRKAIITILSIAVATIELARLMRKEKKGL